MFACEVEITGPKIDLHSGMYGGVLMNPLQALAELCASLHTPDGRVNIPGFYDLVVEPEAWEREQLATLGLKEKDFAAFLGIKEFHTPPGYTPFEAIRFMPTLEFNGFTGGYQGEGTKTVIPSRASAKITCRLVPNQTPDNIRQTILSAIRARCPKGVELKITEQHSAMPYVVIPPDRSNAPKRTVAGAGKGLSGARPSRPRNLGQGAALPARRRQRGSHRRPEAGARHRCRHAGTLPAGG